MKDRICVVTTTRADYGIFRPLLSRMKKEGFDVTIAVGGTHLKTEYGHTIDEIIKDDYGRIEKFDYLKAGNGRADVAESASAALLEFSKLLDREKYDLIIVLGDRYEILSVAHASLIYNIPLAHLHGGEVTEGAIDDSIRNAVTKIAKLHFPANEQYRQRIIRMGEDPENVYDVGALGVEAINNSNLLSKEELTKQLGLTSGRPYIVMTYHPVTAKDDISTDDLEEVLSAVSAMKEFDFIITKSNADMGGQDINDRLESFSAEHENVYLYDSLGALRYLSAVKYAELVLGNSSSGIIEAPSLKVPTLNIGERQKGRMRAPSVIDTLPIASEITKAVYDILEMKKEKRIDYRNPYGNGDTSGKICRIITEYMSTVRE